MDPETKRTIEAILATSKGRKPSVTRSSTFTAPPPRREFKWETPPPPPPPRPEPVRPRPAYSEDLNTVNTKDHIAVLSVNQAKACIVLRAVMDPATVAKLENLVPAPQRKYDRENGVWEFHPVALKDLKTLLQSLYKDVQVLGVQKQIPQTKFDQLMSKLDKEDRDKIYRLLASKYHPDRGGDKDTMALVNLVFRGN